MEQYDFDDLIDSQHYSKSEIKTSTKKYVDYEKYKQLQSENATLRERLARLVKAAKDINTAIEKEEPTDDGWFSPSIHVDYYTALNKAIADAEGQ